MTSIARLRRVFLALGCAVCAGLPAVSVAEFTVDVRAGRLIISNPEIPLPAPGVPVAAGYVSIANYGAEPDRLIAASSPMSERVEIHSTTMSDGVMQMRRLDDGVALAGRSVTEFEPGALHLMFVGVTRRPVLGEAIEVQLTFERAGGVPIRFFVVAPGTSGAGHY